MSDVTPPDAAHLAGQPVSAATYQHGCRCNGCRACHAEAMVGFRQQGRTKLQIKVASRKRDLAAQWVRKNRPDVWAQLADEAYAYVGLKRAEPSERANVRSS